MRLNPECVRTIILFVEERTSSTPIKLNSENYVEYGQLGKFDFEVVRYHIDYCKQNNWLFDPFKTFDPVAIISDLTPAGHDFADQIRDDDRWKKAIEMLLATGKLTAVAFIEAAVSGFAGFLF